jgi:hypothetical protein
MTPVFLIADHNAGARAADAAIAVVNDHRAAGSGEG